MSPLLSIIIPTKDRYSTLIPVVESLLAMVRSTDFEVVVQDNSVDNTIGQATFANHADRRVRYFYEAAPMSIVANTERAIENSSGEFLCFIGDDDTVAPYIVDEVRFLKQSGQECLIHAPAYYWWRSVDFIKADHYKRKGALWMPRHGTATYEVLSSARELRHMLRNGAVSYYRLPRFYHGVVSRNVLDRVKQLSGHYVPGASPDMALAVAVALVTQSYLYAPHPVTVFGASRGSGGGRTAQRSHHGKLEDQAHLPAKTIAQWDSRLPRYWSEYTIYPQTVHEVLSAFGASQDLDFLALYASILINEPWLARKTWPMIVSACGASPRAWGRLVAIAAKRALGRAYRAFSARLGKRSIDLAICPDIATCMTTVAEHYAEQLKQRRINQGVSG